MRFPEMRIQISDGRVIDPGHLDGVMDILIEDGKIIDIIPRPESGDRCPNSEIRIPKSEIIDASGKIVTPGLIDMHVHLREPGYEYKETIETGCRAAAFGGFTAICAMPNTNPANDSREITKYILKKVETANIVRVYPVAAISRGLKGERLCEYEDLKDAGAVAVSDDGNPVTNSQLMRKALEYAAKCGLLVISHCEDLDLSATGAMNEGKLSTQMGLEGIPNAAESVTVMREIALCELTGTPLHIAHVSTGESVRAIRDAKSRGLPLTAETAPHYFTLTEEAVTGYNTNAKMNPPLRSRQDREAVCQGLADETIDAIATDHAPHTSIEKDVEFDLAPNGIIGLETSVPLGLKLVENDVITMTQLLEKMSTNPARILGLDNRLTVGNAADITIIDPDKAYKIDSARFQSRSRNTPFEGWNVKGKAVLTMVGGKIVYRDEEWA